MVLTAKNIQKVGWFQPFNTLSTLEFHSEKKICEKNSLPICKTNKRQLVKEVETIGGGGETVGGGGK